MATQGRKKPKVIDPKVQTLVQALRGGNYFEHACAFAGIAPSTAYRWIERGRNEAARIEAGDKPDANETEYLELCNTIEKARAEAVVANVTIIQQAARSGTWQAAAWWLERTMPQQFGRQIKAEVTTNDTSSDIDSDIQRIIGFLDEMDSRSALEVGSGTGEAGTTTTEE
jgi:hypothetical protein